MEDYIMTHTGGMKAHGSVAKRILDSGGDPRVFQPFEMNGRNYIFQTVNGKEVPVPVANADATLRHEEWLRIDEAVQRVARERLRAVDDLRTRGLTYRTNGLGDTVLLTEKQSDINDATISMGVTRQTDADRPVYDTDYLPLPIIHKDFFFDARVIAASRKGNTPLDTSMVEMCTRKVAETAEKLVIGRTTFPTYGGGTIQGYTNFSSALTQTLTTPVGSSTVGATLLSEILTMRQSAYNANYYGPYMIYNAPNWDQYLDEDFKTNSDKTIRQRIEEVEGIQGFRTLDYMQNYDLIMVQMTSEVVRLVVGMDITVLQWETMGGLMMNYKVMAILVPQLRADYNGNTGIVYGSV